LTCTRYRAEREGPAGDVVRSPTVDRGKRWGTVEQTPDWQVPGYENVEELGRGGFGRVVLARRLADGMPAAVKYLAARLVADPGFRADFQQEARTLAGLESAHTVRLYEYVETGGEPATGAAIVMEYVPGDRGCRRLVHQGAVVDAGQTRVYRRVLVVGR
jgi:serine/threonine protein kinase